MSVHLLRPKIGCLLALALSLAAAAGPVQARSDLYVSNSNVGNAGVSVVSGDSNSVTAFIPISAANATGLAFSPDGYLLYVSTADGPGANDIAIIDTRSGSPTFRQQVGTITIAHSFNGLAFNAAVDVSIHPSGRYAFVHSAVQNPGHILIVDLRPESPSYRQPIFRVPGLTVNVELPKAFTPDGREYWMAQAGGYGHPSRYGVVNIDTTTFSFGYGFSNATEYPLPDGWNPQGLSISPDGNRVYLSAWGSNRIRVVDRATRAMVTEITGGAGYAIRGNAVTPDGTRLYAVTDGSTVLRAYNTATNTFINDLTYDNTGHDVHFVHISGDSERAWVVGNSRQCSGWFGGSCSGAFVVHVADITQSPPQRITDVPMPGYNNFAAVQPANPDTAPPMLTVPADIEIEATSAAGASAAYSASATDDRDPNPVVACTPVSGSTFALGHNIVTCTATDAAGNSTARQFRIIVRDTTPPLLSVPSSVTAPATDASGAAVSFSHGAVDQVDPTLVVHCAPPSGGFFPIGTTTVVCSVSDDSGNSRSASVPVTVTDTTPPVLNLPASLNADATGPSGALVGYSVTATDNYDANPVVSCEPTAGSLFAIGTTAVNCTATDAAGNQSSSGFELSVLGAAQQTDALVADINSMGLPPGTAPSLLGKLGNGGCGPLNAFLHEVSAQSGKKKLSSAQAAQLNSEAQRIQAVLGCG